MRNRLRVQLLATNPERRRSLAKLVEAAGHEITPDGPEVVLADIDALRENLPPSSVPIVALGAEEADASLAGTLPPSPTFRQVDGALRAAASGLIVRVAPSRPQSGFQAAEDSVPLLTPREAEVMAAIALGLSNKEVARRLGISAHTVKFHLEAAFRKLGANSRADAAVKSLQRRLIEL